ncbi:flagellar biosynthetic protein FliR [Ancylobacter lacus]|uniref:flagellar biosynthetic protein FliR n=1 Tax=Ancylobacter lacus TaxID=2579970 RepID=UPI001BD012B6|nr:flagellar type III secretion system protein FliR [Ancylobacter lacus]
MTALADAFFIEAFLIFCRIGACLMLMPAISSGRIPMHVRLFLSLGISLGLLPLLGPRVGLSVADGGLPGLIGAIFAELLVGGMIGLFARLFLLALQTMGTAVAQSIGLATPAGMGIEEDAMLPEVTTLFTLTGAVLLFATGQHWAMLRALIESYDGIPAGAGLAPVRSLSMLVDQLSLTFTVALRLSGPFLIYSIIFNFAVGITNKLVPQIPVYFIAMPFITAGGLLLLHSTIDDILVQFMAAFTAWLQAI